MNHLYEEIISGLKTGGRPLITLEKEIISQIKTSLQNSDKNPNLSAIKISLCLLEHSRDPIPEVAPLLIEILQVHKSTEILICTLQVSHKHILNDHFRRGIKLPGNYLEAIKNLFITDDWELREWLLRTIEASGSSAKYFRQEIQSIKPNLLSIFNVHARYCVEIIQLLESRLK